MKQNVTSLRPVVVVILLATVLAGCQHLRSPLATASDTSQSSWCQGDRPLIVSVAPTAGVNDEGNRWDTDETVAAASAHNARLRAACQQ